ncbi:PREDICTED: F-box/FBD/LRR-repeat protein At5g56420-like [Camelina sativa]|uniref:F-box/FBD/LRR-repeat protein At5g56420-like n=1 Tax=Camelina sativa TaxID=90675 RepID=A0ABM0SYN7_CAMSA|nr:PREDICTED: F-box/FBD/LRR-repeat protein At5g56420-like [Camelina sativa]
MEDSFSQLTDDMLIRILSFAPIKDAVATSILSKRWRFLWTLLTRLNFEDRLVLVEDCKLSSDFIFAVLLLHKSPVVESFHLTRRSECSALQMESWVRFAVDRFVRDLKIDFEYLSEHCRIRLPSGLFRCETLETLELNRVILSEVPSRVSLPSLKTLRLICLKYTDEGSFIRLVSSSPVLEDLDVWNSSKDNNGKTFTINVPSLRSLTVFHMMEDADTNDNVFVIHSPSLNHLDIFEEYGKFNIIGDFPKVVEASLEIDSQGNVLESLTFVKRLSLSLYYG